MDNIERQVRYARQSGTEVTPAEVLDRIRRGAENESLTPGQRKRKRLKRGGTRRALNGGVRGMSVNPGLFVRDEVFPPPQVVEVFGQRWELPRGGVAGH
jgi:hypothetical protein